MKRERKIKREKGRNRERNRKKREKEKRKNKRKDQKGHTSLSHPPTTHSITMCPLRGAPIIIHIFSVNKKKT